MPSTSSLHTASYSPSPWAQPIDGLEAIRRFWDAGRSGPDERFRAQREIVAIDAPVAVVRVAVDYDDGAAVALPVGADPGRVGAVRAVRGVAVRCQPV
jgi:hypothetical protein